MQVVATLGRAASLFTSALEAGQSAWRKTKSTLKQSLQMAGGIATNDCIPDFPLLV